MNRKGTLATFDALTFFMIALIISVVITVAVMGTRDVEDLRETRRDMDESAFTLSVIVQYTVRSCFYENETGASIELEDRTVLNLLDFCLTNLELNRSCNTSKVQRAIQNEIDKVMQCNYQLTASSQNHIITIPSREIPAQDKISTSLTCPATADLGGNLTIVLRTWD